jgi:endoglucanase
VRRALAVLLAAGASAAVAAGCGGDAEPARERTSAERFLEEFVARDGRVVRRDQGGDTVSEGQAYAMLVAAAEGDEGRFDRVWDWTRRELQRPDGLLSWHWKDGRVVDEQPAADADLDAAAALVRAADRFDRPELAREASRIGAAIVEHETVPTPDGPLLVAGPWARGERVVNPGYIDPAALAAVGRDAAGAAGLRHLERMLDAGPRLPSDWARLDGSRVRPAPPPGAGDEPVYGYDAVRLALRLGATCDARSRRLGARLWPVLEDQPGVLPRALDGTPRGDKSAVALAAAAGAARAARDDAAAERLLGEADELEARDPTYFGSALVALARTAWKPDC